MSRPVKMPGFCPVAGEHQTPDHPLNFHQRRRARFCRLIALYIDSVRQRGGDRCQLSGQGNGSPFIVLLEQGVDHTKSSAWPITGEEFFITVINQYLLWCCLVRQHLCWVNFWGRRYLVIRFEVSILNVKSDVLLFFCNRFRPPC